MSGSPRLPSDGRVGRNDVWLEPRSCAERARCIANAEQSASVDSAQYPLSKQRCCLHRPIDLGRRTGIDRNVARNRVMSCAFAPAIAMPIGTPRASVTTDRLTPSLPRSVGFLPVFFPAQRRLGHGAVQRLPTPCDSASRVIRLQTFLPEAMEDAPAVPFLEVAMRRAG